MYYSAELLDMPILKILQVCVCEIHCGSVNTCPTQVAV